MKNKINILVKGGVIQMVMSDNKDERIEVFDLDNDPELEEDFEELTKNQHEINVHD